MIRLLVGKDVLGMIAEECGIVPVQKPDPNGEFRTNFVQLVLPVLCGNSKLEFYANVRREDAVEPPPIETPAVGIRASEYKPRFAIDIADGGIHRIL